MIETRSEADKRSISYALAEDGVAFAARERALTDAIAVLSDAEQQAITGGLSSILTARLAANGGRAFGVCETCEHHRKTEKGAACALLAITLEPHETRQICHEHVAA